MLHMRFSRCQRVDRKSPSLYMPKSEGAYNRKFLNFYHFFDFVIEFPEPLADRLLGNAINLTEFLLGKLLAMPKPEQLLVWRKDANGALSTSPERLSCPGTLQETYDAQDRAFLDAYLGNRSIHPTLAEGCDLLALLKHALETCTK